MIGSRPARVWGLVAGQAARRGGRVSAADACVAAVAAVEVTGAWLITASGAEAGHLMRVTDEVSELLAELQLTLGEGPGPDASASGGPVLASDLDDLGAGRRWPVFAAAAGQAAAGSGPGGQPAGLAVHRAEIDQATGMLTEQLGVGIAEAFIRLRAYAYAHDRRLGDLARDIVARRVRLRPDPGLSPDSPV